MNSRVKAEAVIAAALGTNSALTSALEEAVYIKANSTAQQLGCEPNHIYLSLIFRLLANLSQDSTVNNGVIPPVYTDFISGKITATELVAMDNSAINTTSAHLYNALELRKKSVVQESYSTEFTCGRCKSSKAREYRDQTRSGDEGYTYKVECIVCGNKWSPN